MAFYNWEKTYIKLIFQSALRGLYIIIHIYIQLKSWSKLYRFHQQHCTGSADESKAIGADRSDHTGPFRGHFSSLDSSFNETKTECVVFASARNNCCATLLLVCLLVQFCCNIQFIQGHYLQIMQKRGMWSFTGCIFAHSKRPASDGNQLLSVSRAAAALPGCSG